MGRGEAICQELKKAGISNLAWLCDSETHFMSEAISRDPELKLIKVCHEGEAIGVCMGLYLGGNMGALLMASQGMFQTGNILKCAIDSEVPMLMLVGSGIIHKRVKKNFAEPFLDAFGIKHYLVEGDADVEKVGLACKEAHETRKPVALLLRSADSYEAGR